MIRTGWTGGNRKKANRYIVEIEKAALKEVRLKERGVREAGEKAGEVYQKGRGESAEEGRAGRAPQTAEGGAERHARWRAWWSEKLARLKFVKKESADETHKSPANADTTEEHSEGDSVERNLRREIRQKQNLQRENLRRNIRQKEKLQRETRAEGNSAEKTL